MKIAIVRQQYNPFGGAEVFVSRTLQALAHSKMSLHVLARSWGSPKSELPTDIHLETINPFYIGRLWRDWGFARAIQRHCLEPHHAYDIIQSHERIPGCMIYRAGDGLHRDWLDVLKALRPFPSSLITTAQPYHHYLLQAETAMFNHPALRCIIAVSPMVMKSIIHHFPHCREKVRLVFNGVDMDAFQPKSAQTSESTSNELTFQTMSRLISLQKKGLTALFVGSGFERKGLTTAIRAVAAIEHCQLIVVGADKHLSTYQRLAHDVGAQARIHFFGPQKNMPIFYRHADVLIFPTHYEPFGNVVLEALASGIPAITSPTSGAAILIQEGVNGFVRPASDPEGNAEALKKLTDTHRRQAMNLAARESALPYNLTAMRESMLAVYRELM